MIGLARAYDLAGIDGPGHVWGVLEGLSTRPTFRIQQQ